MKNTSFLICAAFVFVFVMTPVSASASKVGEIIKVKSPPGTVETIENNFSDRTRDAIPYWDEDLPNSGDLIH